MWIIVGSVRKERVEANRVETRIKECVELNLLCDLLYNADKSYETEFSHFLTPLLV